MWGEVAPARDLVPINTQRIQYTAGSGPRSRTLTASDYRRWDAQGGAESLVLSGVPSPTSAAFKGPGMGVKPAANNRPAIEVRPLSGVATTYQEADLDEPLPLS
jgi:hypothetical protein